MTSPTSVTEPRKRARKKLTPEPAEMPADPVEPQPAGPAPVSVLVPWRPTPERQRLWDFLRPRWDALGWQVVEGSCEGPWRKGVAVADALTRAEADVIVVADADVWCDGVVSAVNAVNAGKAWAIPHYRVLRLTAPATADVLSSGTWPRQRTPTTYAQRPYPGRPGGGMVVLTRALYERVPIDVRFKGWGQEDESWALALGTLAGPSWRGTEDLWHLWHAPQVRQSRTTGSAASLALHRRYVTARKNPPRMRSILAEDSA